MRLLFQTFFLCIVLFVATGPATGQEGNYVIQVSSWQTLAKAKEHAAQLRGTLAASDYDEIRIVFFEPFHSVRIGWFESWSASQPVLAQIKTLYPDAMVFNSRANPDRVLERIILQESNDQATHPKESQAERAQPRSTIKPAPVQHKEGKAASPVRETEKTVTSPADPPAPIPAPADDIKTPLVTPSAPPTPEPAKPLNATMQQAQPKPVEQEKKSQRTPVKQTETRSSGIPLASTWPALPVLAVLLLLLILAMALLYKNFSRFQVRKKRAKFPIKPMLELCRTGRVVVVGLDHQRRLSYQLPVALLKELSKENVSLFVGLQVPMHEQGRLDQLLEGENDDLSFLYPAVEDTDFAEMLLAIHSLRTKSKLAIRAIGGSPYDDDPCLALRNNLAKALTGSRYSKVVILVDTMQAIRDIQWGPGVEYSGATLTGLLLAAGATTRSIVQLCSDQGSGAPRFLTTDSPQGSASALKAVAMVNHADSLSGSQVADGVLIW